MHVEHRLLLGSTIAGIHSSGWINWLSNRPYCLHCHKM